ncbi:hypothetical protein [Streptomyces sp. NPDC003393]
MDIDVLGALAVREQGVSPRTDRPRGKSSSAGREEFKRLRRPGP